MGQHKWKLDVGIILILIVLFVLAVLVLALNQVNWDIRILTEEFEEIVKANEIHLTAIGLILPVILALGSILGRWIGHKRHESRQQIYDAEINQYKGLVDEKNRQLNHLDLLLEEYKIHHG